MINKHTDNVPEIGSNQFGTFLDGAVIRVVMDPLSEDSIFGKTIGANAWFRMEIPDAVNSISHRSVELVARAFWELPKESIQMGQWETADFKSAENSTLLLRLATAKTPPVEFLSSNGAQSIADKLGLHEFAVDRLRRAADDMRDGLDANDPQCRTRQGPSLNDLPEALARATLECAQAIHSQSLGERLKAVLVGSKPQPQTPWIKPH